MHKDIQRFLVCNLVLVLYLTSLDMLDFVLRLMMVNILYGRLYPDTPSLVSGWEKHFCDWLGGAFVKVSSHVYNMPALELVVVLVLLKVFSWITFFLPDSLLLIFVAETVAAWPFIEPSSGKLMEKVQHLREKFENSVLKVYRIIPRYNKPMLP